MRIRFFKINWFIGFIGSEKYDAICNGIRFFISQKSGITYISSHYFAKIKVDSYYSLPIEKILTLHNVVIQIKPVLNKDKNLCF